MMNPRPSIRQLSLMILGALVGFLVPMRAADAQEAVLILPARVPAFARIEEGLRGEVGLRLSVRTLVATDFDGKPGGIVAAALAEHPVVLVPFGTTQSRVFLAAAAGQQVPPLLCVVVSNPADVLAADQIASPRTVNATVITDGPNSIYPCTADLVGTLYPATRVVATVANQGESNSLSNLARIRSECERKGWRLVEKFVSGPQDVEAVANALLAEHPDAVWISKDRTMTTVPGRLIELAHRAKTPVFASDAGTVETFGALGTCSVSFEELGKYIGKMMMDIKNGADVRQMPVSTLEATRVYLSRSAIQTLGVSIPPQVDASATYVGADIPPATAQPRRALSPWVWSVPLVLAIVIGLIYWRKSMARRSR